MFIVIVEEVTYPVFIASPFGISVEFVTLESYRLAVI